MCSKNKRCTHCNESARIRRLPFRIFRLKNKIKELQTVIDSNHLKGYMLKMVQHRKYSFENKLFFVEEEYYFITNRWKKYILRESLV
jgi:hypothetical protein